MLTRGKPRTRDFADTQNSKKIFGLFWTFSDLESTGRFWTFKAILNTDHLNMVLVHKNPQWSRFKASVTSSIELYVKTHSFEIRHQSFALFSLLIIKAIYLQTHRDQRGFTPTLKLLKKNFC